MTVQTNAFVNKTLSDPNYFYATINHYEIFTTLTKNTVNRKK